MWMGNSLYWVFQTVGWGAFGAINVLFAIFFEKIVDAESARIVFTRLGIFVLLGIVITHLMRALIVWLKTVQKTVDRQMAQLFFITVLFSLTCATLYILASLHLGLLNEGEKKFADQPLLLILSGGFYFFINIVIWNLTYFIYHYVIQSRKQQLDASRLESLVKELELNTMVS